MIEPPLQLSVRRQCELLRVCRSGLYYEPEPTSSEQLELMRRIDELHLKWPFYGSRKITQALIQEGREVNRKRVRSLNEFRRELRSLDPGDLVNFYVQTGEFKTFVTLRFGEAAG